MPQTRPPPAQRAFSFTTRPQRVVFGQGSLDRLPEELDALGAKKALVLCTPNQRAQARRAADALGARVAGLFAGAVMHVPLETAREARALAARLGADCAVAIGGGSTIGLGKAIALDSGLPVIAVPTTYAGSEMTPIYGITDAGHKSTGKDYRVLPRTVIYDPALSTGLPLDISITSGINAIAHAAEGLYAVDSNPLMDIMACEGIAALARALPALRHDAADAAARSDALYGAWMCGTVLGNVGMALHHKLCHTLGGSFNLPHAQTHTIVLPHALAYNAGAAPQAMRKIAAAIGRPDAARGLYDFARENGAAVALRELGMQEADVDTACEIALQNQYPNPRPLEREALRALLHAAWAGERPPAAGATG